MNSVERIKAICKERKIPIYKLEKECGFSNGYIGQLRKGTLPYDRAQKIADFLEVSVDFLMTGQETKKAPTPKGERSIESSPAFFRLKEGLAPYDITENDADFLLEVFKSHIKRNQQE